MTDNVPGPVRPSWVDDLLAEVDVAFRTTGADMPGWADPHADGRSPDEAEYSRVLDPGKYRILHTRVEAWVQVLEHRGVAVTRDVEPAQQRWLGGVRPPDELQRVRYVEPVREGGLSLLLATTVADGEAFGLDVGLAGAGLPTALLAYEPGCGCDACDRGSDLLLDALDGWWLTVARGGLVHTRGLSGHTTSRINGWTSSGTGSADEQHWEGAAWL